MPVLRDASSVLLLCLSQSQLMQETSSCLQVPGAGVPGVGGVQGEVGGPAPPEQGPPPTSTGLPSTTL